MKNMITRNTIDQIQQCLRNRKLKSSKIFNNKSLWNLHNKINHEKEMDKNG